MAMTAEKVNFLKANFTDMPQLTPELVKILVAIRSVG
jgi:hypothetical protein